MTSIQEYGLIQGCFDGCDGLVAHGWACNPHQLGVPLMLEAVVDGATILRITADRFRPDLAAAGYGDGRHGFVALLPETLCDGRRHVVGIQQAGTGTHLPGGPRALILAPDFRASVQPLLLENAALRHRLALNEQRMLSAGRRLSGQGCDALDPALGHLYARIVAAWPPAVFGDEE